MNAGKELAELIHAARTRLGLTGDEFGQLFGVKGNQVSRWEHERAIPPTKRAAQFAEVCERPEDEVSDLITRAVAEHRESRQDMMMTITRNLADVAHAVDNLSRQQSEALAEINRRLDALESELQALRTASRRKTS